MPKVRIEQARLDRWLHAVKVRQRREPNITFSDFVRDACEAASDEEHSRELNDPKSFPRPSETFKGVRPNVSPRSQEETPDWLADYAAPGTANRRGT